MAEKDYNFENYLSQDKGKAKKDNNTSDTQTTCTTSNRIQPFSARLGSKYVEIVKAVAWWQRITQREFIEQVIYREIAKMDGEKLDKIIEDYRDEQSG